MDVSSLLYTLPRLIQVKKSSTPELIWSLWRREKLLSALSFEPWTIQTVEMVLYTPRYSGFRNIALEQVMTDSWTRPFHNLDGNPALVVRVEV